MSEIIGETIDIDGIIIYYEKVGNGDHKILLLPGALGSIELDFTHQMRAFDSSKFTLIAMDPPGYGKSQHQKRVFINWYQNDADLAVKLMEKLEIKRYSILGFCDGGRSAILIASQHPEKIEKIVLCGASTFLTPKEKKTLNLVRDVSGWSPERQQIFTNVYGDGLSDLWCNWMDAYLKITNCIKVDIVGKVICPTLIIHGEKDIVVSCDPHAMYLKCNIKKSRVHIFKDTQHACQEEQSDEFNKIVQEFLSS